MVQTYQDFPASEKIRDSRPKIAARDEALRSCFSDTAFPTSPAPVVGQYCFRTDEKKLYQCLESTGPIWVERPIFINALTATALRAIDAAAHVPADAIAVLLETQIAFYRYDPTSEAAHNGTTVLRPAIGAASTGAGRWLLTFASSSAAMTPVLQADSLDEARSLLGGAIPDIRDFSEFFGATFDDPDEDLTTAFQTWIDRGVEARMPRGVLAHTGVQWKPSARLYGSGGRFFVFPPNKPDWDECSWLRYIGAGGSNTAAINCSAAAVGTAPSPSTQTDETKNLFHGGLSNLMIDAGSAEYGLYMARCGYQFTVADVIVTGSTKRGIWLGKCWGMNVGALFTTNTGSTGISIGENIFGWDAAEINAVNFHLLEALMAGVDYPFDETTAILEGNGINWMPERSSICHTMIGEWCDGLPVYYAPGTSNQIGTMHLEFPGILDHAESDYKDQDFNGNSAIAEGRMTDHWFLWVQSATTHRQNKIHSLWASGASGVYEPKVRIAGDAPAEPMIFGLMHGIDEIVADHGKYELQVAESTLTDSSAGNNAITRHLPQVGRHESLINDATTLYCGNVASTSGTSGNGSGRDTSNLIPLSAAIEVARVNRGVTTFDLSQVTSTAAGLGVELDGRGITREIILDGGTTGRLVNDATNNRAIKLKNFAGKVTLKNFLTLDRCYFENCANVLIDDCPTVRMGAASDSVSVAALNINASTVHFAGTSVVNNSASSATTKIAAALSNGAKLVVSNAAAGTFTGYTTGNAIHFDEGGGEVHVSITTETASWARQANITKNAGGSCGIVYAPNGVNPYGGNRRQSVTIASGAITISKGARFVLIDTEAAAATDDLDTINYSAGEDGDVVYFAAANGTRDVVFKDGTGNMKLSGDFTCDTLDDTIALMWDGVALEWKEIADSNN